MTGWAVNSIATAVKGSTVAKVFFFKWRKKKKQEEKEKRRKNTVKIEITYNNLPELSAKN